MESKEFLNKEIDEANEILSAQHAHIKWYTQTYLLALFGFLSLAGYLEIKKEGYVTSNMAADVVVVTCSIIIFCLGWIFLSSLAHKISMITMLHKHLAALRRLRLESFEKASEIESEYIFPLSNEQIRLPGLIMHMPYWFFALNFSILSGTIFFVLARHIGLIPSLISSFSVAMIVGLFYPRVCITFRKHMRASNDANTIPEKYYLEDTWEEKRKARINVIGFTLKYFTFTLILSIQLLMTYMSITNKYLKLDNYLNINMNNLLFSSLLLSIVYLIARYATEVINLKIGFTFKFRRA